MPDKQTYDPASRYDVVLARPVTVGPFKYLPRDRPIMTGKLLNKIIDQGDADVIGKSELCD